MTLYEKLQTKKALDIVFFIIFSPVIIPVSLGIFLLPVYGPVIITNEFFDDEPKTFNKILALQLIVYTIGLFYIFGG